MKIRYRLILVIVVVLLSQILRLWLSYAASKARYIRTGAISVGLRFLIKDRYELVKTQIFPLLSTNTSSICIISGIRTHHHVLVRLLFYYSVGCASNMTKPLGFIWRCCNTLQWWCPVYQIMHIDLVKRFFSNLSNWRGKCYNCWLQIQQTLFLRRFKYLSNWLMFFWAEIDWGEKLIPKQCLWSSGKILVKNIDLLRIRVHHSFHVSLFFSPLSR